LANVLNYNLTGKLSDYIENGIYWSKKLEALRPKGFGPEDDQNWDRAVNLLNVIKVKEGCGRLQNRLIVFEDSQTSCMRHRQNNDQIQGDIFSFYLSRILKIDNLPPSTLSYVKPKSSAWSKVRRQLQATFWNFNRPVVITKFINDLVPAYIPAPFKLAQKRLHPIYKDLARFNLSQLIELMQWSDLIVFDYLTANLDRVVNNMFNQQWNQDIMNSPTHNLMKTNKSGLLLFLDNESGLLHGYRLLKKYEPFHRSLLNATCIFTKRTADTIEQLYKNGNVVDLLRTAYFKEHHNGKVNLPFLPERNANILNQRIANVYKQIKMCHKLYSNQMTNLI